MEKIDRVRNCACDIFFSTIREFHGQGDTVIERVIKDLLIFVRLDEKDLSSKPEITKGNLDEEKKMTLETEKYSAFESVLEIMMPLLGHSFYSFFLLKSLIVQAGSQNHVGVSFFLSFFSSFLFVLFCFVLFFYLRNIF